MAPKLYSIIVSPPVRAVLICAKVLGIELDIVNVNLLEGDHFKPEFLKMNPQHTVPVLEDEDGFLVSDSHAIMAYLVAKYGKDDSLYPKDIKQRATIDHRLHFDSGILFARGVGCSRPLVLAGIKPTQEKVDDLRDAFQIFDQILANNETEYVAGNNLSIADFSIITTVTACDIFVPYKDFPNVKAYVERIQKLPCYEVNREGLAMFHKLINSKLEE